jgi:hypothetical protein
MSVRQTLILPLICLRTNVLGRLIATATYLAKPRFEDSAALIGGPLCFPARQDYGSRPAVRMVATIASTDSAVLCPSVWTVAS